MINDLKQDSNNYMNEVKKPIQSLDKKINKTDDKFSRARDSEMKEHKWKSWKCKAQYIK
jgi:hypothetical protein